MAKEQRLVASLNQQQLSDLPSLDRYLYNNWMIQDIIAAYVQDLKDFGKREHNQLELYHAQFLERYLGIVKNNLFMESIQEDLEKKFLTEVSLRHPDCCFALRGRLKSLYRLENKFNANVQDFIIDYITKEGRNPTVAMIIKSLSRLCDAIAYRFILQSKNPDSSSEDELKALVEIANGIPEYFNFESLDPSSKGGYKLLRARPLRGTITHNPSLLSPAVRPYYKDYVSNRKKSGFTAFTICMRHNISLQEVELQLMTFDMFKLNEHSENSDHRNYEMVQKANRLAAQLPDPNEFNKIFLQAHERLVRMSEVDLSKVRVKLFCAFSKHEIEDFCGLVIGRQAKPVEYLI